MLVFFLSACVDIGGGDTGQALDPVAQEFLDAHNAHRSALGIADLSYSFAVEASAQAWADALAADNCAFEHENQSTYGENLWWSSYEPTPTEVVDAWAGEVAYYDYDTNTCEDGQVCGHYTQVVWADTTQVGCAQGACAGGAVIWVCRYDPPGNWVGQKPY